MKAGSAAKLIVDAVLQRFLPLARRRIETAQSQEAHPECSSRVPAIVTALAKMHLTPKFRGSEITQLQPFRTATVEDMASVHFRSYIFGLEKAMEQASEQGIIHIDGLGPTYATATVRYLYKKVPPQPVFSATDKWVKIRPLFSPVSDNFKMTLLQKS